MLTPLTGLERGATSWGGLEAPRCSLVQRVLASREGSLFGMEQGVSGVEEGETRMPEQWRGMKMVMNPKPRKDFFFFF